MNASPGIGFGYLAFVSEYAERKDEIIKKKEMGEIRGRNKWERKKNWREGGGSRKDVKKMGEKERIERKTGREEKHRKKMGEKADNLKKMEERKKKGK